MGPKFRNEVKKLVPFKWMFRQKEKDSIYPLKISKRATIFQASTNGSCEIVVSRKDHNHKEKAVPINIVLSAVISGCGPDENEIGNTDKEDDCLDSKFCEQKNI